MKEGDNDILFMAATSLILVRLVGSQIPCPLSHFWWTLLFGSLLGGLAVIIKYRGAGDHLLWLGEVRRSPLLLCSPQPVPR